MSNESQNSSLIAQKAALNPNNFALANCVRALSIDAVEAAQSGHPGAPMGVADAATVLFKNHLKFDAKHPDGPDRDRVVLSNDHAQGIETTTSPLGQGLASAGGMDGFGASGPAEQLYQKFGITVEGIITRAKALVRGGI